MNLSRPAQPWMGRLVINLCLMDLSNKQSLVVYSVSFTSKYSQYKLSNPHTAIIEPITCNKDIDCNPIKDRLILSHLKVNIERYSNWLTIQQFLGNNRNSFGPMNISRWKVYHSWIVNAFAQDTKEKVC